MRDHLELDDVAGNDHTHTLYEVTDHVYEGCPHVDVLGQLLHGAHFTFDLNVSLLNIDAKIIASVMFISMVIVSVAVSMMVMSMVVTVVIISMAVSMTTSPSMAMTMTKDGHHAIVEKDMTRDYNM